MSALVCGGQHLQTVVVVAAFQNIFMELGRKGIGIVDGLFDAVEGEEIPETGEIRHHFMLAGQADHQLGNGDDVVGQPGQQLSVVGGKTAVLYGSVSAGDCNGVRI